MKTLTELQNEQFQTLLNESTQSLKDYIIEVSNKAKENDQDVSELIDEGLLGALVGGLFGNTAGKSIMNAVCKAIGVNEKSALGQLLTSRMILTAVGSYLGYKW